MVVEINPARVRLGACLCGGMAAGQERSRSQSRGTAQKISPSRAR